MVLLKKRYRSSTLVETLVATVILIAVFIAASLVLNTVYKSQLKHDTFALTNRIDVIRYHYEHNKIELPYVERFQNTEIIATLSDGVLSLALVDQETGHIHYLTIDYEME